MTVLADTAIWVSYLREGRAGPAAHLDVLLERRQVLMCGPVAAELVSGLDVSDRGEVSALLRSLPWADIDRDAWLIVGDLARALRSAGRSVALTDLEIAVSAVQAGAALWTADTDFDRIMASWPRLTRFDPPG